MIGTTFKQLVGVEGSLRRKAIIGGHWQVGRSLLIVSLDMIRAAIFARVLFPEDYGLMALATMVVGFFESFSATGIELMILREADDFPRRLRAYWTALFVRGWFLAVLCWVFAFPIARFYTKPELVPIIWVLGVTFILKGMGGFGREIRQRTMDFRGVAIMESLAAAICLLLSVGVLLLVRNVWALVAYSLISAAAQLALSYVLYPWKPGFALDIPLFKKIMTFSGSIIIVTLANYFFTSFDVGTIGKLLDLHHVGLYARANFLALLPATYLANMIAPIMLPLLRAADTEAGRLSRVFWTLMLVSLAFYVACGVVLELCSRWVVLLVYGRNWLGTVDAFRIMLIFGCLKATTVMVPMVFIIRDKPFMMAVSAIVLIGSFGLLCVPMTRSMGIEGTAWAVVISSVLCQIISITIAWRLLTPTLRKET